MWMGVPQYLEEIKWCGVEWTKLPQGGDRQWALVNRVMNIRVHKIGVLIECLRHY